MNAQRSRARRQRGIATLWLVMTIMLLLACVAMAVDVGWVVLVGNQLGSGADASALAGAMEVRRSESDARDEAVAYGESNRAAGAAILLNRNDANADGGDVVVGYFDRDNRTFATTPPTGLLNNAVRVHARRDDGSLGGPVDAIFAPIFGINAWNVERDAIAMVRGDLGPGVIALNPSARCSFDLRGTSASFVVQGGAVVVNSTNGDAACHSGRPALTVDELNVVGETDNNWSQVNFTGSLVTEADPVPDPLFNLPAPNQPTTSYGNVNINNGSGNVTLQPGRYGNIRITGGNVTFASGLYYITGTFTHNGGNVDATAGVMLFFASPNGRLDVAGNGTFRIRGMSPTVYPNGPAVPSGIANVQVPIYQQRGNTQDMELNGTSNWLVDGTIYAPDALLSIRGTPGVFANGLIANMIQQNGNNDLVVDYEDQFPRLDRHVFLVK